MIKGGTDVGKTNGKWATIVAGEIQKGEFSATVRESETEDSGEFVAEYQGRRYVVGEPHTGGPSTNTSKDDITHEVATLVAVTQIMKAHGVTQNAKVAITVNMPLSEYKNKAKRDQIQEKFTGKRALVVNGQLFGFTLTAIPYYEGMGATVNNYGKLSMTDETAVVDLGSLNNGVIAYDASKRLIIEKSEPFKNGTSYLIDTINSAIHEVTGEYSSHGTIESLIAKKSNHYPDWMIELAEEKTLEHLRQLKNQISRKNINTHVARFIFAGGGAVLLKDYLREVFGDKIIMDDESLHANAIGTIKMIKEESA